MKMKFKKEFLQDVIDDDDVIVLNEIIDRSRWSVQYRTVFPYDGKFYETYYSVGATEYQEEHPYEFDPEEIECREVIPTEVTSIVYLPVK